MILPELSEAIGVSGNEEEIRKILLREIKEKVEEVKVDALGNLIAFKGGSKQGPRVMLAAHMDEVGLMITYIEKSGVLRFKKVGTIDDRVLPSQLVLVGKERIPGVIGVKPIHLQRKEEGKQIIKVDQLYIDIGVVSKEEAERFVKVGDYASFSTKYSQWDSRAKGKAFDDRAGCALLVEILKEDFDLPLSITFTVQEEVGLRGAGVAAYRINPELALVLEGTAADDLPKKKDLPSSTILGQGPALTFMDRSVICDRRLVNLLRETAELNGITYQFKQTVSGGTDAGRIHLVREGIPSAVISVPCRYIHSPVSLLDLGDLENMGKLISKVLRRIEEGSWKL